MTTNNNTNNNDDDEDDDNDTDDSEQDTVSHSRTGNPDPKGCARRRVAGSLFPQKDEDDW
eukprot:CAMPEP_0170906914 /NCGR_PEP_ID=MMETSP0735-20130129/980_1 /TAXON_ID=186038 /ORGANISM="Fragilariopsis kerguelensis, Strain L26-C5" /LENGTH=59 /DNA_ID=CAMNT_0011302911 /DNA_START=209 /DNA_END=385 /DNA_ORIENTATION=+